MALTSDFALEGFRIIRERPKLIAFWGAIILFGNGVGTLLLVALSGQAFTSIQNMGTGHIDPVLFSALMREGVPGLLASTAISLLTTSVITCAVCRVVLGQTDDRLGFLKFGLREIQLAWVSFVTLCLSLGAVLLCLIIAALLAELTPADPIGQSFFMGLGFAAGGCVICWLRIRLSLNCVQSFDEKRISIFGSFALTRDKLRPLFLGYLATAVLVLVVLMLCLKIVEAIITVSFGAPSAPDMNNLQAYLTPPTVIMMILVDGLVCPLLAAIMHGSPAAAYLTLRQARKSVADIVA